MRSRLFLLVLSLILSTSAATAADVGIAPPRLSIAVPRGGTVQEVETVFTTATTPQKLAVSQGDWVQADSGKLTFLPVGQDPYSAASWLTPSSDAITVPAKGSVGFRFSISVPHDPKLKGTYKTVLFFQTEPKPVKATGNTIATRQRVGVVVYVTIAGTANPKLSISDFYRQGSDLILSLSNGGNVVTRLGGNVELRNAAGKTVATLPVPDVPVQRGGSRNLSLTLPKDLTKGVYVALALVKPDNAPLQAGQLQLTIP